LYQVIPAYSYDSDFGRDIVDILHITKGDLTLIGPKLSFGGIHTGPYYYYLFAPVLVLSGLRPEGLLVFNAVLFWLTLVAVSFFLVRFLSFSTRYAIISIYFIALTPFFLFSARGPGNAFSYLPLFLLVFALMPFVMQKKSNLIWLLWGVLSGICINTHLVSGIIFFSFTIIWLISEFIQRKFTNLRYIFMFIMGLILTYTPLIVFEIRHDFVMFTNTFVNKSYQAFTSNSNLPNPLTSSTNPLVNSQLLMEHFTQWSGISFLLIFISCGLLLALNWKKLDIAIRIISLTALLSFSVLSIVARSQLAIHYFFPFILISQVSIILSLQPFKYKELTLLTFVIFGLSFFPRHLYLPSARPMSTHRNFIDQLMSDELIEKLDRSNFNVFVARETPLAVLGHEYRYFLELKGFASLPAHSYQQAQQLLFISENPETNIQQVRSWELDQFGPKVATASTIIDRKTVVLFEKEN
jgi:hypothetical protein